jgi:hypothetical protein
MGDWTATPPTWTAGAEPTAAQLQSYSDFANAFGALTAYTPTVGGFTAGNGTVIGSYARVQKMVFFEAQFTFGSTSAAASAIFTFTLPVTAASSYTNPGLLHGYFIDTGTATYTTATSIGSSTAVALRVLGTNGVANTPSTTSPFTWTTGDIVKAVGFYWAA